MSKRAKLSDRKPLLGASAFFEPTTEEVIKDAKGLPAEPEPVRKPALVKLIAYITEEQSAWLEEYAAVRDVSKAQVIRHLIERYKADIKP